MTIIYRVQRQIVFLSFYQPDYSRSAIKLIWLQRNHSNIYFERINFGIARSIRDILQLRRKYSEKAIYIVMSPSHLLAIIGRPILGKKLFLDAGWLLSDSTSYLNRTNTLVRTYHKLRNYCIDFLSLHAASYVWFESKAQRTRCSKKMLMRSTKCGVSYTGFLEDRDKKVNLDSRTPQERESINKKPTLLFRGKYNEEAGIDILVKTIALTETDLNFIVVTNISKPHDLTSGNITWYSERISDEKLTNIYNRVDACLGQLGINERTQFTIPHKAFEAAYFGKAYISKESLSLDEVFGEDCYMRIMTSEPESIAREIVKLTHSEIQEFGTNLENRYRSTLCNEIIVDNFLQDVRRLVGNV